MKISEVINKLQEIQQEKGEHEDWVDSLEIEEFDYDDEILNITNGTW